MSQKNFSQINFNSRDDLSITADLYLAEKPKEFLLLCHRSHFNRGEYSEIAPKLQAKEYSCLAIDQRSGMNVLGFVNGTSTLAKQKNLPTGYLDAKPDIEAAVDYAYEKNNRSPIILVGSSYSASLALLISVKNEKVKALVVFSPGEYLKGVNLAQSIKELDKPILVISAKKEIKETEKLFRFVNSKLITQFKPKIEGAHGARVLWEKTVGSETYWIELIKFLKRLD